MTISDIADGLSIVSFFLSLYAVKEVVNIKKTTINQRNTGQGNINSNGGTVTNTGNANVSNGGFTGRNSN